MRSSLNGGQGTDGLGHHRLQACQGVEFCGVCCCSQSRLHAAQVGRGDARDAQGQQLRLAGVAVHHGLHRIGQRLHLAHTVYCGTGFAVDHIAQQSHFLGCVHTPHTDGGIVGLCGVGCVVGRAIGIGQDGVEAVHNGLNLGGRVGLSARHIGVVQRVVDCGQVVGIHARHAHRGIQRQTRSAGVSRVVLCCRLNNTQCVGGVVDDRLHTRLGVELGGIHGRRQGCLNGAQVRRRYARDAQGFQLRLRGGCGHHGLHRVGQGLHFGQGVHIGGGFAVDHLAQQAEFFRQVDAIDPNGFVLSLSRVD